MTARRSKYGNTPTVVDNIRFASKAEARRWGELKLLQRAGKLHGLNCQHSFDLTVAGKKIARYVADFIYFEEPQFSTASDRKVAEDVKGIETPVFKLKAKLFRALYPDWELRVVK